MASTVGHALCGVTILLATAAAKPQLGLRVDWKTLVLFTALANLPDIDLLIGYSVARNPHLFHSGPTHSLVFALLMGTLVSAFPMRSLSRLTAIAVFTAIIFSHDLIDSLTGPVVGMHETHGMPIFWPFSEYRLSMPVTVFPGPDHATWKRLISLYNLKVILIETLIFVPFIATYWWWMQGKDVTPVPGHWSRGAKKASKTEASQ